MLCTQGCYKDHISHFPHFFRQCASKWSHHWWKQISEVEKDKQTLDKIILATESSLAWSHYKSWDIILIWDKSLIVCYFKWISSICKTKTQLVLTNARRKLYFILIASIWNLYYITFMIKMEVIYKRYFSQKRYKIWN